MNGALICGNYVVNSGSETYQSMGHSALNTYVAVNKFASTVEACRSQQTSQAVKYYARIFKISE